MLKISVTFPIVISLLLASCSSVKVNPTENSRFPLQSSRTITSSIEVKLDDRILHQGLVNESNYGIVNKFADNYSAQNTLNVGWLGVFRRYNSGETMQNRTVLDSKRSTTQLIFDMDGDQPVDWSKVILNPKNEVNLSPAQTILALDTVNIKNPDSPILLMLLSNQHIVSDYLSNPASEQLRKRGYTVAVLEYPNYGASIGSASLNSWVHATVGAVKFLNEMTGRKVYIVGHSIGGPLALQAATNSTIDGRVAGVITYGGFSDIYKMAQDNTAKKYEKALSGLIVNLTLPQNKMKGIDFLDELIVKKIPTLILHGENDGPVPVRHAHFYQQKLTQLKEEKGSEADIISVQIFPGLFHEEINNYSLVKPTDFETVWGVIGNFLLKNK